MPIILSQGADKTWQLMRYANGQPPSLTLNFKGTTDMQGAEVSDFQVYMAQGENTLMTRSTELFAEENPAGILQMMFTSETAFGFSGAGVPAKWLENPEDEFLIDILDDIATFIGACL